MNDFFAAIEFMQRYPQATGKVGITGFCYGGGVSNAAAVAYPELACAVPFYGRQAPTADVAFFRNSGIASARNVRDSLTRP